ncbi:MAG: 5,6-dimethylbenzimidazole synthase, partial [Pseudomonadota bacterium]
DVRHFKTDPIDAADYQACLDAFKFAPSVGLSEPWRLVRVTSDAARMAAFENFKTANDAALAGYDGEQAQLYAGLKLSGMKEAPEHLAIFCDDSTDKGAGLGAQRMPEMRRYSAVCAITLFWLKARSLGIGVGWVSILDPKALARSFDMPDDWSLVGYLCIGYPAKASDTPELEQRGWEDRDATLATPIEV